MGCSPRLSKLPLRHLQGHDMRLARVERFALALSERLANQRYRRLRKVHRTEEPRRGLLSGAATRAQELGAEPAADAHQQGGPPYLRTLLVQGAQHILGPFGVDCDLRRWGLKLAERGGKSGKKRAMWPRPESWRCCTTVGQRRSLRTVAQQPPSNRGRICAKQTRSRKRNDKSPSRVPVTAPGLSQVRLSGRAEPQGANQIAAPAETRTPNMHRSERIAPRECERKLGDSGKLPGKKLVRQEEERTYLTPTGLLMQGHSGQILIAWALAAFRQETPTITTISNATTKGISELE